MYGCNIGFTKAIRLSIHALAAGLGMAKTTLSAMPIPEPFKDKVANRVEDAIAVVVLGVGIIIARVGLR